MPVVKKRGMLSGITVENVMRRQLLRLPAGASIDLGIHRMIKFKVSSLLITDQDQQPAGIVSKTDIVGAFYAGFPVDTSLEQILVGPLLCCFPDDELEDALDSMQHHRVHRLYVRGAQAGEIIGLLAYPDIVGLLYRYCRSCRHGRRTPARKRDGANVQPLKVAEVMTPEVTACRASDSLTKVIESLTAHRLGAVLIRSRKEEPVGVVSKTDLVLAYRHGQDAGARAGSVMNSPVHSCPIDEDLTTAIQQMLLLDIQRIFVHAQTADHIVGVLSLSDAARFRSGSCRACVSSRLMTPA